MPKEFSNTRSRWAFSICWFYCDGNFRHLNYHQQCHFEIIESKTKNTTLSEQIKNQKSRS